MCVMETLRQQNESARENETYMQRCESTVLASASSSASLSSCHSLSPESVLVSVAVLSESELSSFSSSSVFLVDVSSSGPGIGFNRLLSSNDWVTVCSYSSSTSSPSASSSESSARSLGGRLSESSITMSKCQCCVQ